jgi:hypothetical protein
MSLDHAPRTPHPASSLGDTLRRWLPLALLVGTGAFLLWRAARPLEDPDLWWHLRLGDDLWRQRSLRAPSDWSPRQTVAWVPSEPLPEVLASRLEHGWGLPSLAWLHGLASVVVLAVVYLTCRREAGVATASVVAVLTVCAMSASLTPRPQLVSFVLLALVPVAWSRAGEGLRPPWWLVPLTWLWSTCHGFWVLGVGLSALCWLGVVLDHRPAAQDALRLALVPVASLAVVLLSPAGWEVVVAPLSVDDTTQYISEWARASHRSPSGIVGAVLLVVLLALMVAQRRDVRWSEVLLLVAAAFFWWYALRTVAVAALVVAPLLTRYLARLQDTASVGPSRRLEVGVLGVGSLVGLLALAVAVPSTSARPGGVPTGLSGELDRLPAGTGVLNAYEFGGWLAWRHPDLDRTSDGLVVPYDPDYIGRLVRVQHAVGDWTDLVDDLDVDYALMPADARVSATLEADGWAVVGEADDHVLLSRPGVRSPGP